jgi:hypothetical protein
MSAIRRIILIGLIAVGALASSDWNTEAAGCPPGYGHTSSGDCMPPGYTDCGNGGTCPGGSTCGANHTCVGGAPPAGPLCGATRCPEADQSCTPGGRCYSPRTQFLCGEQPCYKSLKYPPGDKCACQNRQVTAPEKKPALDDTMKDAVADTPKKKTPGAVRGLSVREALWDATTHSWTCVGVTGFPDGPTENPQRWHSALVHLSLWHFCRPAGSVQCPERTSYACPAGTLCNGDGTYSEEKECRMPGTAVGR